MTGKGRHAFISYHLGFDVGCRGQNTGGDFCCGSFDILLDVQSSHLVTDISESRVMALSRVLEISGLFCGPYMN